MFILTDLPRINPQILNNTLISRNIAEFRSALRNDPSDQTAHYGLGVAYFNLGLLEDSARELENAALLMPENPHIQTQLASVYETLASNGDQEYLTKAQERVKRALLLRPGMTEALLIRAKVWLLQRQFRNAVIDWRHVAQTDEDAIRQSIGGFLSQHLNLLSAAPGIAVRPIAHDLALDQPSNRIEFSVGEVKAFLRRPRNAFVASFASFALMILIVIVSPDEEGTISGLAALLFLLLLCSWLLFMVYGCWRLWKSRREQPNGELKQEGAFAATIGNEYTISDQRAYLESLSNGSARIGELLGAATYVANELTQADYVVQQNTARRAAEEASRKEAHERAKLVEAIKAANIQTERRKR